MEVGAPTRKDGRLGRDADVAVHAKPHATAHHDALEQRHNRRAARPDRVVQRILLGEEVEGRLACLGAAAGCALREEADVAALFTEASPGLNMTGFSSGNINFDVKVMDAGNNTTGWIMKADCVYPCTSGDQPIGTAGLDGWQTVSVPVSQLVAGGLDLSNVSTGIVIWPDPAGNEGFTYRIDNVYWSQ